MAAFEYELHKLEVQNAREHIPTIIGIMTGQKPQHKRVPLELIEKQVEATRQQNFTGLSFLFLESLFKLGYLEKSPKE